MLAFIIYLIIILASLACTIRFGDNLSIGREAGILLWIISSILILLILLLALKIKELRKKNIILNSEVQKQLTFARIRREDEHIQYLKQQAELITLQNQINPHFLYNTLESIRGEMIICGQHDIAKMTEILSKFFRYNISYHGSMATLKDELDNAERYIMLQKYRFEDRIRYHVKISEKEDADLLSVEVPKLILQPIIENSICHGIEPKVEGGEILVNIFRTDRRLFIRISDDGVGMSEETLAGLRKKLKDVYMEDVIANRDSGGIALYNINLRFVTLWGEQYGLEVYSTKNVGTDIVLTMPFTIE